MQEIKEAIALWSSKNFGKKNKVIQAKILATAKAINIRNKKLLSSGEVLRLFSPPDTGGKLWKRKSGSGFVVVPNTEHLLLYLLQTEWEEIKKLPKNKQLKHIEKWLKSRLDEVPTVSDMLTAGRLNPPRPNRELERKTPFTRKLTDSLTESEMDNRGSEAKTLPLRYREMFSYWLSRPTLLERVLRRLRRSLGFLRN